jgi:sodium/hydrogen antiporter
MTTELIYLLGGGSLLLAVVLPVALSRVAVSAPMVLLGVGALIGLLPSFQGMDVSPVDHREFTEHLTEFTVLIALMGVGLALDRGLSWWSWDTWKRWGAAWRLLIIAMPVCIAAVALLGWWAMGVTPAAAVLLGAALSPTDPVLASGVQVEGPTPAEAADEEEIDESDEVRFALTSEAGLNDGLAFPFVYLAILMAASPFSEFGLRWFGWDLVGKVAVGAVVGSLVGWALSKIAFRGPKPSLRLAETGEPLLALAAVLLSYGSAETAGGYGFLAVFACALTLRSAERGHDYHVHMHQIVERLERLMTLVVLLLLGVAMTNGMLRHLTWEGALVGVALVFLLRPLVGSAALWVGRGEDRVGDNSLSKKERVAVAFFGVRGVGSLFYLAYAPGQADFGNHELLWATVGFTIALSVFVHGITAMPAMRRLELARQD